MLLVDFCTAKLSGAKIIETVRRVSDLKGIFEDEQARLAIDPERIVYRVQAYFPVSEGTPGGLFWGNTVIEPGVVGKEYFMTKGHWHALRDRGEYYITVGGEGALILMDEGRKTWREDMRKGSVHYIPSHVAHRVANTGSEPLAFLACWPSDAGHDYQSIEQFGFSARVLNVDNKPRLVASTVKVPT